MTDTEIDVNISALTH